MSSLFDFFTRKSSGEVQDLSVELLTVGGDANLDWSSAETQYRQGYMMNAYVEEACELYAVRLSSIDHVAFNEAGEDITDSGHPLIELLDHPNPALSRHAFYHLIGLYLGIYGEAFVYPHRIATGYDALYIIDPKMMTPTLNSMDLINPVKSWRCTKYIDGVNEFLPEEIIHIKFPDPNMENVRGLSRMVACGKNVEMMNSIKQWNIKTTRNGAKPSMAIKVPQKMTEEQHRLAREQFRQNYQGGDNAGSSMILDDGKDVTVLGMTAVEMDYQQGLVNAAKEIAIAYGIPPEMMGDSANKTYSNAQEASRQIVVNTIRPILDLVYQTIWGFFRDKPIAKGIAEYTYDEEQLADFIGIQTDLYTALQSATFLTINDKREKLGYGRIEEPLADQVMITMSDVPISEYSADDLDPGRNDPSKDDMSALLGDLGL